MGIYARCFFVVILTFFLFLFLPLTDCLTSDSIDGAIEKSVEEVKVV